MNTKMGKSKSKNFYVILLCSIFVLLVSLIVVRGITKSFAATVSTLPDTMTTKSGDAVNDRINLLPSLTGDDILTNVPKYVTDDSGNEYLAYCLNKDKGWPNSHTVVKSSKALDNGYSYIVLNGYPTKSLTGNNANDIYLTQIALWLYQDRVNGVSDTVNGVLTANQKSAINSSSYKNIINDLVDGAINAKSVGNTPTPIFSVGTSSFHLSNDGEYLVTDLISVTSNVKFESYQVSLNNSNYIVLDENNNPVTGTIVSGKKFKISIPLNKVTYSSPKTIKIDVITNYTQHDTYLYEPLSTDSSASNIQDVAVAAVVATLKQTTASTTVTLPTGSLTIKKVSADNTGVNLEGATIEVKRDATNEIVATFTTTDEAYTISGLLPGSYTVTEKNPPAGYSIDSQKNITISDTNLNQTTTLTDTPLTAKIRKVDENDVPLAGAVIKIYKASDNSEVKTITSTTSYVSISDLSEGSYYALEYQPPLGYKKNSTRYDFTLSKSNNIVDIKIPNEKNSTNIIKVDEDGNKIAGAVLRVIDSSGNKIDEWTTTISAHTLKGLTPGVYYVEEVSPPLGYTKSSSQVPFVITADQQVTQTVSFQNTKNTLSILKVDENSLPIAGAKLRIYNSTGTYSKEFITKTSATTFERLASGTYYIEEIEAPDGFVRDTTRKTITITENTTNETVTFMNKRNVIKIAKVDQATGQYLAGAKLKLVDSNGSLVDSWTSTNDIHIISSLTLKHGTYTLTEESAPSGYLLNTTPMTITIDERSDNEFVYQMVNRKVDVSVLKVDEDGRPLAGVTLTLLDSNKKSLNRTWLTTDRPYKLDGLSEGTYYVQETDTIDGYILDKSLHKIVIDANHLTQTIQIENKPITVQLAKIDAITNQMIAGATLVLRRQDNTMEAITWISTTEAKVIKGLKAGTYVLEEAKAPAGYVSSGSKLVFEVKRTGEVQKVALKSTYVTLNVIDKKLNVDTNGISGFKFSLLTKDGEEIESWASDKNVHITKQLANGDYILKEIEVPEGYIKNNDSYQFSVTDSNTVDVVKLLNNMTTVSISKKDITNGDEVSGAELVLKNANGETIDTWISTNDPHIISKLPVGKYKLIETIAPDGYVLNKAEVEFEVLETGEVQSVTMYNEPKVEVPNTGKYISNIVYIISISLMAVGAGLMLSAVKRKRLQ